MDINKNTNLVLKHSKRHLWPALSLFLALTLSAFHSKVEAIELDDLSNSQLTEHFGEFAFGQDDLGEEFADVTNTTINVDKIRKWEKKPIWLRLRLESGLSHEDFSELFAPVLKEIISLTGVSFVAGKNPENVGGEMWFFVGSVDYLKKFDSSTPSDGSDDMVTRMIDASLNDPRSRDRICLAFPAGTEDTDYIIYSTTYVDTNSSLYERCLWEATFQIMGLGRDSNLVPYTMFRFYDGTYDRPTLQDKLLLKVLYDDRVRAGMTREEALPIVRKILDEMRPEHAE